MLITIYNVNVLYDPVARVAMFVFGWDKNQSYMEGSNTPVFPFLLTINLFENVLYSMQPVHLKHRQPRTHKTNI